MDTGDSICAASSCSAQPPMQHQGQDQDLASRCAKLPASVHMHQLSHERGLLLEIPHIRNEFHCYCSSKRSWNILGIQKVTGTILKVSKPFWKYFRVFVLHQRKY